MSINAGHNTHANKNRDFKILISINQSLTVKLRY